jgi:nitrite reductase (NO-forming)
VKSTAPLAFQSPHIVTFAAFILSSLYGNHLEFWTKFSYYPQTDFHPTFTAESAVCCFTSRRALIAIALLAALAWLAIDSPLGRSAEPQPPIAISASQTPTGDKPPQAPPAAAIDPLIAHLTPKAQMQVVRGEKTTAPQVPAPITRTQSMIVTYKLTVREGSARIAPNLIYQALWTFDDTVPGPVMRARVGDVVRFTLSSASSNVTGHNIDFHFVSGACGGCHDTTIKPGQDKTIEVRALYPGVFMYHCAFGQQGNIPAVHIANGMYGFLIIDPAKPLPKVNHEFMLVESEFYVEKAGKGQGICSYNDLIAEKPSYIFFNGKHSDLHPPLTIHTGDRVRLYVGRGGVNGWCAFHVIGAIFDKVYQDGNLLDPPAGHGVQTVNVPVGGATVVEFVAPVPGVLTAVDHNLSRVAFKGTSQVINVVGAPNREIFEAIGAPDAQGASDHCSMMKH